MRFNWFNKKEVVEPIYKDLPIMVADEDYLEFLEEEGTAPGDSIEMVEAAELFGIWMAENCD